MSWMNVVYRALGRAGTGAHLPQFLLRDRPDELAERLGRWPQAPQPTYWLHAASVGELTAAGPFVRALRGDRLGPIALTAMTRTGRRKATELDPDVGPYHAPIDAPGPVRRAVEALRPKAWIAMETELWPALSHELVRREVPLAVVSARLSPSGLARMKRAASLYAPARRGLRAVGARTEDDAQRWREFGIPAEAIRCTGDLKEDGDVPPRADPPTDLPRWVAACTRPGEEEEVLAALEIVEARVPRGELMIAPRHPERFEEAADRAARTGRPVRRWDRRDDDPPTSGWSLVVVDRMGVLDEAYRRSSAAFVGGSLVPVGGHSPWEAACAGRPVVMGPDVTNCADAFRRLERAGGAVQVDGAEALGARIATWLTDPVAARRAGEAAHAVTVEAAGAARRTLDFLRERGVLT